MKRLSVFIVLLLIFGCAELQTQNQQQLADRALAETRKAGNSGPLYDHYVSCLNTFWRHALDQGGESNIYEAGLADCSYALGLLCNYYAVSTCFKDAKLANRILFSLMLEDYHADKYKAFHTE